MQNTLEMIPDAGIPAHPAFLRRVLLLDAATCFATGLAMTFGTAALSGLTLLPEDLLRGAGVSLFPIALFMAAVALRRPIPAAGVWLIILGNIGWVAGSLYLLSGAVAFNALGAAFVAMQAFAVAGLAALEVLGVRRLTA